jgi:hypothetical protein
MGAPHVLAPVETYGAVSTGISIGKPGAAQNPESVGRCFVAETSSEKTQPLASPGPAEVPRARHPWRGRHWQATA